MISDKPPFLGSTGSSFPVNQMTEWQLGALLRRDKSSMQCGMMIPAITGDIFHFHLLILKLIVVADQTRDISTDADAKRFSFILDHFCCASEKIETYKCTISTLRHFPEECFKIISVQMLFCPLASLFRSHRDDVGSTMPPVVTFTDSIVSICSSECTEKELTRLFSIQIFLDAIDIPPTQTVM